VCRKVWGVALPGAGPTEKRFVIVRTGLPFDEERARNPLGLPELA
jgi:hypothetical protein